MCETVTTYSCQRSGWILTCNGHCHLQEIVSVNNNNSSLNDPWNNGTYSLHQVLSTGTFETLMGHSPYGTLDPNVCIFQPILISNIFSPGDIFTAKVWYLKQANIRLASCPWGPATAHGVGILTELYVIYMERYTSHRAIARCFGLGLFLNLALCQPHWQPASAGKPF